MDCCVGDREIYGKFMEANQTPERTLKKYGKGDVVLNTKYFHKKKEFLNNIVENFELRIICEKSYDLQR